MLRRKIVAGIVGLAWCALLTGPAVAQTDNSTPAQPDNSITTPAQPDNSVTTPAQPDDTVTTPAQPDDTVTTPAQPDDTVTTPAQPDDTVTAPAQPDDTTVTPAQPDDTTATPDEAGPTMTMDGVIANINWTMCTDNTADCITTIDLTSAPSPVTVSGERGTDVAASLPVQVIIPAGGSVTLANGNTVPATDLRKGDDIVIDYQAYDYGNVATSITWRARLGDGQVF